MARERSPKPADKPLRPEGDPRRHDAERDRRVNDDPGGAVNLRGVRRDGGF